MSETVTVTSKGQITIPSKVRKKLKIAKGEKLLISTEDRTIKITLLPKLSEMAGIDEALFKGRKPSRELESLRKEWTDEFEK